MSGWSSKFPPSSGLTAGGIPLFEDARILWALNIIGSIQGKTVLELGPLEGGHTYMLSKAGAAHITSVEANADSFLKCLITKELFALHNVSFLLGNFMPWIQSTNKTFDLILAAGVLYHLTDPVELLHQIGKHTNATHIWTHYIPDQEVGIVGDWAKSIFDKQDRLSHSRVISHYLKAYGEVVKTAAYCGGVYGHATWLRRADILEELGRAGFTKIEIGFEDPAHPHGPCLAIAATKS